MRDRLALDLHTGEVVTFYLPHSWVKYWAIFTGNTSNRQSSHLYTVSSTCYAFPSESTIKAVVYNVPALPACLLPPGLHDSLMMWPYMIALPLFSKNNDSDTISPRPLYEYSLIGPRDLTKIITLASKKLQCSQRNESLFISSWEGVRCPWGPRKDRKVCLQCEQALLLS